jgi:Cobalamin biosynthesis protein CobN and related Mg-chelatases
VAGGNGAGDASIARRSPRRWQGTENSSRIASNPSSQISGARIAMSHTSSMDAVPLCPSAQPEMKGSIILGVVGGSAEEPRLGFLSQPQPVTEQVLALAEGVKPTEIFRFAAPCAGTSCVHFDGKDCRLASRIVKLVPPVVDMLPSCRIRPECRWWQQEGKAACLRCPLVVTENYQPSAELRSAATPQLFATASMKMEV